VAGTDLEEKRIGTESGEWKNGVRTTKSFTFLSFKNGRYFENYRRHQTVAFVRVKHTTRPSQPMTIRNARISSLEIRQFVSAEISLAEIDKSGGGSFRPK